VGKSIAEHRGPEFPGAGIFRGCVTPSGEEWIPVPSHAHKLFSRPVSQGLHLTHHAVGWGRYRRQTHGRGGERLFITLMERQLCALW